MTPGAELLFEIPRGLEQSILLAVLVGFVLTWFLVETFGWVFVGVVVPGYLASVLVIQPPAALAALLDASLTYAVARLLEVMLGRSGASCEFFGRERFFLLVLVSVFVRQHTLTWIWPMAMDSADSLIELPPGFSRSFSSIGIVLVPLMANLMWKLDLRRGAWQLAFTTLLTYALLAWWLLPETTLSYSAMELSYEDTAIDFMGNAKAYIIFLCTGYIASQLNLYYGWDFNGILVPALLGLLWLHPTKLLATFGETIVVYMVAIRLPKAPGLRSINLEGPRRLAMVFITLVVLKWTFGTILGDRLPTLKITDLYGFGYLLPALLVIKMMQRKSIQAVLLPTAVASLLGFIAGSLIGFALSFADPPPRKTLHTNRPLQPESSTRLLAHPDGVGALGQLLAMERADSFPDYASTVAYRKAWEAAARWVESAGPAGRAELVDALTTTDLELVPAGQHEGMAAYALLEHGTRSHWGWGTALLVPGAPGPYVLVPRPVAEAPLAEAATVLCRRLQCRGLLVAGVDVERDPLTGLSASPFDLARDVLRNAPMMVLRADPLAGRIPVLHVGAKLPESIDLRRAWPAELALDWSDPPIPSGPVPRLGGTLRLNPRDVEAMLGSSTPTIHAEALPPDWIMQRQLNPLGYPPPMIPPPSPREARYLERQIVEPLIDVAKGLTPISNLNNLAWRAERLGLEVWRIDDCGDGRPCLGLLDPLDGDGLGWGSLLVRWGQTLELAVEIPRPTHTFGTHQLGMELWHQSNARALYIGPTNTLHEHNPLALGNIHASLMPFHQALDRSLGDGATRPLILQILGFKLERMLDTDMVVGLGRPVLEASQQPLKLRWLLEQGALSWARQPLLSDGSPLLHPLSGLATPAVEYSLSLGQADVALLWFSPDVRQRYVRPNHRGEQTRTLALGIPYGIISEFGALLLDDELRTQPPPPEVVDKFEELMALAVEYRRSHDIHALRLLLLRAEALQDELTTAEVTVGEGSMTHLPMMHIRMQGLDWSLQGLALLGASVDRRLTRPAAAPDLRAVLGMALLQRDAVIVVHSGDQLSGGASAP